MGTPNNEKPPPLFTRRKNRFGWDLNIGNRLSYVILAIILNVPFAIVIFYMIMIKK